MKLNDIYEAEVIDYSLDGNGVCKVDNFVVFVPGTIKDEIVEFEIIKLFDNYGIGKLLDIKKSSQKRVSNHCKYANECGGCSYQHIDYLEEVKIKREQIEKLFKVDDFIFNEHLNYRNKVTFKVEFTNKLIYGFYKKGTHELISIGECNIINDYANKIIKKVIDKLNDMNVKDVYEIIIRYFTSTKEGMVIIKSSNDINSFVIDSVNSIILLKDNEEKVLYGENYIFDIINGIKYKVSANSFYQVNNFMTSSLYNVAISMGSFNKEDIVMDAYSGAGTIALQISDKVKKVYGVEINKDAIKNANYNKKINNKNNVEFIQGDVVKNMKKDINKLIVDPPRSGLNKKFIKSINVNTIIYISCNAKTQKRDCDLLIKKGYKINKVVMVDMFPRTMHTEVVVLLTKQANNISMKYIK